ncbi:MAG: hypothetical protein KBI44_16800, partial [Thermoanaerobaculia bacterium]|nr:hypothetical protein [Thermoanaerobaculia bacterium]
HGAVAAIAAIAEAAGFAADSRAQELSADGEIGTVPGLAAVAAGAASGSVAAVPTVAAILWLAGFPRLQGGPALDAIATVGQKFLGWAFGRQVDLVGLEEQLALRTDPSAAAPEEGRRRELGATGRAASAWAG